VIGCFPFTFRPQCITSCGFNSRLPRQIETMTVKKEKQKPQLIEVGEWLYFGCFIQKVTHPKVTGNYVVFKNNKQQSHVGNPLTFIEAKLLCKNNQCFDNYLKF
jgi:hypothetical protein